MSYFLGIDLGTSYFKTGIFDENGKLHGLGRHFVEKNTGDGNTCELEVAVFRKTIRRCIEDAMTEAKISAKEICALSYASQANSFILLDSADKPLTPIIVWSDGRVKELPAALQTLTERPDFMATTGLGIQPGHQSMIAKIDWFQKKQPQMMEKVKSILSISDYLIWLLTGEKVSDGSTSSMTGLLNSKESKWWQRAMEICNIEEEKFSTLLKIGTFVGRLSDSGAEYSGLSQHTSLFSGALDHHAVAIGAGLPRWNYISESSGTVLACVNYRKGYHPREGVNIAQGLDEDHSFQMAFCENGAAALEQYQKIYAPELTLPELLALTKKNHPHARPVQAILESTGASLLQLVKELDAGNEAEAVVPSGGGAKSDLWLQMKANRLDKVFLTPDTNELACKGAAILCSIGMSYFKNMNEAMDRQVHFLKSVYPDPVEVEKYKNNSL